MTAISCFVIMKDIKQTIVSACQSGLPNFPDTPINKITHAAWHCATIAEAVNWIVIDVNVRVIHPSIHPTIHPCVETAERAHVCRVFMIDYHQQVELLCRNYVRPMSLM